MSIFRRYFLKGLCIRTRKGFKNPGDVLLSHTVTRAVPSAMRGLTTVFGMGTGVTLSLLQPGITLSFER